MLYMYKKTDVTKSEIRFAGKQQRGMLLIIEVLTEY